MQYFGFLAFYLQDSYLKNGKYEKTDFNGGGGADGASRGGTDAGGFPQLYSGERTRREGDHADEFYLSIVINERDSKGKISVESQQRDMIAALKRLGVNVEKQLKVANLSSEFFKKNTSVATAKYQLQLGSSAEVAKVWQALDGLGISNVSILKVSHSKIDRV